MDTLSTVDNHIAILPLDPGTIIAVNNHGGGGGTKAEAALLHILTSSLVRFAERVPCYMLDFKNNPSWRSIVYLRVQSALLGHYIQPSCETCHIRQSSAC